MNMTRNADTTSLYLDLMKKALTYSLWEEPGVPVGGLRSKSRIKKYNAKLLERFLKMANLQLVRTLKYDDDQRVEGRCWSAQAHTMIGFKRLSNIQYCVEKVLANGIKGDLIETGVWRGGSCIFMRAILAAHGVTDRRVFVADSFAGFPNPDEQANPMDRALFPLFNIDYLAVSQEEVADHFRKYGLFDDQVVFLKGWFKDTLPGAPIENLAVMRLDGDLYDSTMAALVNLYPKLSKGGFCIIDDFSIDACRKAVHDYRVRMNIDQPLEKIDWTGVFWQK